MLGVGVDVKIAAAWLVAVGFGVQVEGSFLGVLVGRDEEGWVAQPANKNVIKKVNFTNLI